MRELPSEPAPGQPPLELLRSEDEAIEALAQLIGQTAAKRIRESAIDREAAREGLAIIRLRAARPKVVDGAAGHPVILRPTIRIADPPALPPAKAARGVRR